MCEGELLVSTAVVVLPTIFLSHHGRLGLWVASKDIIQDIIKDIAN